MSHLDYITKNRKGKHLNYEERIKIEALSKIGMKSEKRLLGLLGTCLFLHVLKWILSSNMNRISSNQIKQ